MSTYILIHGAWRSSSVWTKIAPILEANGHTVITPNLPGHDAKIKSSQPATLDDYVNAIINIVNQQKEKVILTGHSMAGAIISLVAEQIPERIEKLVYLCAFFLENGESMNEMIFSQEELFLELEFNSDYSYATVKESSALKALYNETKKEDALQEIIQFVPQAMDLFDTKVILSDEKYGSVPRFYIKCTKDNAISIELQNRMLKKQPCQKVYTIDTDHSPFLSSPQELGEILLEISNS